jgi:transcription elongation factor Elf1
MECPQCKRWLLSEQELAKTIKEAPINCQGCLKELLWAIRLKRQGYKL